MPILNKVYMGLLFRAPSTNQNLKLFKWNFQLATRGKGEKAAELSLRNALRPFSVIMKSRFFHGIGKIDFLCFSKRLK